MNIFNKITKKRVYITITACYVFLSLLFLLLTTVQSQETVGKKHPGFLVFDNGLVFGLIDEQWSGAKAGLKMYDFIESYNSIPFTTTKKLFEYLNSSEVKEGSITYQIKRSEERLQLRINPLPITQDFAFLYYYIFLFCGFFTILTGIGIFVIRPLAKGAFHFFVICNTIGIFEILLADMLSYQSYLLYLQLAIALYAMVNTQTIYYLLKRRDDFRYKMKKMSVKYWLTFVYVLMIVLAVVVYHYSTVSFSGYRILLFASNSLFFLAGMLIYVTATYLYYTSKSSTAKRRLLLYMGLNMSCFVAFAVYVSHNVCAFLAPVETLLIQLCFPFVTVYVLFKYNFLDLKFTPKRKFFYLGFAVLIPVLFLVDFVFIVPVLHKYSVSENLVMSIVMGAVLIKVFLLIYAAYARIVDKLFFPSTYKFRDTITNTSHSILKHQTQEGIMAALIELLSQHLEIKKVYCYYQKEALGQYFKQRPLLTVEKTDKTYESLISSFSEEDMPLIDVDFVINEFSSNRKTKDPALELLIKHDLNLLLPLKLQNYVCGFVLLGPKPNFVPYTTEDLTNLQSILVTTTVALLNAKNHESLKLLHERLEKENKRLKEEIRNKSHVTRVIGETKGLKSVMQKIEMIQNSSISVLLHGETGTGKEVIAQVIHEQSLRSNEPFIKVNCAAIPENLFESELFGYEKGAFTGATEQKAGLFEAANGGTLFLDEIGEVPLHIQAKLLRALQEKEIQRIGATDWLTVDVRIIAATNRDLNHEVREGRFRQDLFYRLNVLPVFIPPLRDRQEDLDEFLDYFIRKYSLEMKKHLQPPTTEDIRKLKTYPWPGNVRELQNVVERSVALSVEGERIQFFSLQKDSSIDSQLEKIFETGDFYLQMEELKKQVLQRAIRRADGNKSQAARELGLHQVSLYKMVKQLGVE